MYAFVILINCSIIIFFCGEGDSKEVKKLLVHHCFAGSKISLSTCRISHWMRFVKEGVLKNSQISQENTCVGVSLACNFIN